MINESNALEIFEDIRRNRKTAMKNMRETWLEGSVQAANEIIKDLESIGTIIENKDPQKYREVREQLADCYGILGGTYRRWAFQLNDDKQQSEEKFELSLKNYERGNEIDEELGKTAFYNKLNTMVAQLFVNPAKLEPGSNDPEKKRFYKELEQVEESLNEVLNTEEAKSDAWRWADYGMLHVLLDMEDPISAYAMFTSLTTDTKIYGSVLSTLEPLSKLPLPVQSSLQEAVHFLKQNSWQ